MKEDKKLFERCEAAVDARLSGRRLDHVHSVSECAARLAKIYGANVFDARLAGLLHDWDKLYTDEELLVRMDDLGIEVPEHVELLYPVLHSLTGARAVQREFPELSDDIISAIARHTLGAVDMSKLDMVIFIADMIEPLRDLKHNPGIKKLRKQVGKKNLGQLYFDAYANTIRSLVDRHRYIHPMAFEIWNALVARYRPPKTKSRQGNPDAVL